MVQGRDLTLLKSQPSHSQINPDAALQLEGSLRMPRVGNRHAERTTLLERMRPKKYSKDTNAVLITKIRTIMTERAKSLHKGREMSKALVVSKGGRVTSQGQRTRQSSMLSS